MIFVDANVFIYTVGRAHPLKAEATAFFGEALAAGAALVTSAEVLQELLHYFRVQGRNDELGDAWALAEALTETVWDVTHDDLVLARALARAHPALSARDLVHLACCQRRKARALKTYDKGLAAAWAA